MDLWQTLVRIHESGDWTLLVVFYGIVAALVVFVCIQLLLVHGRRLALRATREAGRLAMELSALEQQVEEMERRIEKRLDEMAGELNARMTSKLNQKGDLIEQRIDQRSSAIAEQISKLDSRVSFASTDVDRFQQRIDEVEARIPGLFDKLDDFRDTLARTFQAELGSVLNSFDNSIASVLQQMKSELQLGISRIESIEGMVTSKERAEKTLLGGAGGGALPEAADGEDEPFGEWEEEAKELARELPDDEPSAADEELPQQAADGPDEYPAEIIESDGTEETADLEEGLYLGERDADEEETI
jgi:DNA anti-recombination protein RmuC